VDSVEPLVGSVHNHRSRHRRRVGIGLGIAMVIVAAAVVLAITHSVAHRTVTIASGSTAGPGATSSATQNGVSVVLQLKTTDGVAGESLSGTVTITNHRNETLHFGALCPQYALLVSLTNNLYPNDVNVPFIGCGHPFTVPPGTITRDVTVSTMYTAPAGKLPLPAGRYQAGLLTDSRVLPTPAPITVELARGRGPSAPPPATSPGPAPSTPNPPPTTG